MQRIEPKKQPADAVHLLRGVGWMGLVLVMLSPEIFAQPYVRQVEPFVVWDAAGEAYSHPFLGGLNVPRPHLADLDADGDLDLFLQERSRHLLFFENTGTAAAPRFTWRTDAYAGLDVGEWMRFADLDADGDLDVLAEEPISLVRFYRNTGTPAGAVFELAADTLTALFPEEGDGVRERPLFADRQNLPALADIDCDGHLDLFMATLAGFLTYYAGEAPDADGLPAFRFVTDRYQDIAIIGEFGKTGAGVETRHGANGITFNDLDADGDPDLFWGDFFSPSLYFLQNTGTCAEPVFERTSDVFPMNDPLRTSGWNIPHFADIDGDGDADLFAGVLGGSFPGGAFAARNFYYYRHDEGMTFTLQSRQFVSGIDVGEESTPAWVDLDADGDLDLVAGNRIDPVTGQQAQLFLFENEGSSATPAFRLASDALVPLDGRFNTAPAFADLDADGDPDLLLGSFSGALAWYRNDGTAAVPAFLDVDPADIGLSGAGGAPLDVGQNSTPAFADLDADGDLDLLVGESAGTINFFRNTGTPGQPNFVLETESYAGLDAGARSVPALHDLDGDGLFDLIVGTSQDGLLLFRNTGTPQNATFAPGEPFTMPGTVPRNAAPVFADFDADGDDDFFTGGIGGGLFFYRNDRIRTATEPVPDARPNVPVFVSLFPNPFRDAATIHVRLARAGYVRLVVYDALGRVVVRLADGFWASGEQRIRFDARGLPTGVYFYRLTHADGTTAGAMLHVR